MENNLVPGFLYQIEARQNKVMAEQRKSLGSRLLVSLRSAHRSAEEKQLAEKVKVIGIPAPESIHERMEAFIKQNKDKPGMPKSKKALALACIEKFLSEADRSSPSNGSTES